MLREGINRLRGQVRIRVECAFPERVLNLCGAREMAFWDLEWESPVSFTCRLSRREYGSLQRAAEKLDCRLEVLQREGMPFFLGRFRSRTALAAGLVLCGLGLFLGSFFIWDFEVEGNQNVSEETIMRALEHSGVGLGTFGLSLDSEDLRNRVLLEVPELSWIAVNVSGCRATVQVRERRMPPELMDERTPANVVARRAGMVLDVQARSGRGSVLPGTSVTEGQLLISGVEDTGTFGAHFMTGEGTVTARTWYTLKTVLPLHAQRKQYTGEEKTAISLVLGRRRIKFFSNSSIEGAKYDKIIQRIPLSLLGVPLPVTVVAEQYRFYENETVSRPAPEAEQYAGKVLTAYLKTLVEPYGSITSTLCSARQRGDTLEVTLTAECREEIGQSVPILQEETDGEPS